MSAAFATDVLVIGAGVSGLTASYILTRLGVRVRVVDAMPRIGGRILPENVGGSWVRPRPRLSGHTLSSRVPKRISTTTLPARRA